MSFLRRLGTAGAGFLLLFQFSPVVTVAGAYIRLAHIDKFSGNVIIDFKAVALNHSLIHMHAQPFQVLRDHLVSIWINFFRVGIFQAVDVFTLVFLDIVIVDDGDSRMSDVQGA